jgi:hypothetical protein
MQRLTKELVYHSSLSINQNFNAVRMEYVPYLRSHLLDQFIHAEADSSPAAAVNQVIATLDSYGLSRDDLMESMKELQFIHKDAKDDRFIDRYDKIDSKLKAQLTRAYNSMEHTSQALIASQIVGKKKGAGRAKAASVDDDEDWEGEGEDGDEAAAVEEEEEEEVDLSMFIKKGRAASASKSSSAKASSSSKPSSSSSSSKAKKK